MILKGKKHINKAVVCISMIFILAISLMGCTPDEKCTDIRLKIEEDGYLSGWTYVKDIDSLDNETNPTGRILFALYENEDKPEEYAVLSVVKLTVPDKYDAFFTTVTYDESSNTATSLDEKGQLLTLYITYGSEMEIKDGE